MKDLYSILRNAGLSIDTACDVIDILRPVLNDLYIQVENGFKPPETENFPYPDDLRELEIDKFINTGSIN
jgi:hypothetical protein